MRLLIDNNLSYKLCTSLQEYFPGSNHVRSLLTPDADDLAIWNFAKDNNYIIITKDNDFNERSLLEGCPPKVIHLLCGNRTTAFIEQLILKNADKLLHFSSASTDCLLKFY